MNVRNLRRSAIATAVIAALATGYALQSGAVPAVLAAHSVTPTAVTAQGSHVAVAMPDFASIVAAAGPAVVNVSVTAKAQPAAFNGGDQMDENNPMFEFFKHFGPQNSPGPQAGQVRRGVGSGFIISADGLVMTNAHVVAGADEVMVKLTDRREFVAKVLGVDKQTDIAVLRIDAKNLPTVKIGNPAQTRVGDWVLAIGSPFGFENSVTSGIVSAKSRSLPDGTIVPFIQTDAAINPGNSGGPLFNMQGEVIGINSQIYSGTGGYQGLSFAIPIDVATKVQAQLVATGKVTRGRLGVMIQNVDQALAQSFGLDKPQGALISAVEPGSAADKAGLKSGDVIVKMDGKDVVNSTDLPLAVAEKAPGSQASLSIVRKGERLDIQSTLVTAATGPLAQATSAGEAHGRLGLAVRGLTAEERKSIGASGGVVVESVGGAAARAGIQAGDVILAMNGTPISGAAQLRDLAQKAGKTIALLVQREEAKIFVPINLG
ncbi:MAG: DegQ family serine endoprotease [Betaproteobacteria bacterium]